MALLVGGGEGMGPLHAIARAISEARLPLQLVVIAGRNAALKKSLAETVWDIPRSWKRSQRACQFC
jgi:1,2-diacylglycerol 3-beta-galactosyltransferase